MISAETILYDCIAIDSSQKNELALADYIYTFCKTHSHSTPTVLNRDVVAPGRANVVVYYGEPRVLIDIHSDTVPVGNPDDWHTDPFTLTERDGRYYGLGAADTKQHIALALAVIAAQPIHNIGFVFSCGEETDCAGLLDYFARYDLSPIRRAVTLEPTNGNIVIAHKGTMGIEFFFKGIAAHSATPSLGKNAIVMASDFIARLQNLRWLTTPDPVLGNPTCNVGLISGGTASNIVPDACYVRINVRYNEQAEIPALLTELDDIRQNLHLEVEIKPGRSIFQAMKYNDLEDWFINQFKTGTNALIIAPFWTHAGFFYGKQIQSLSWGIGDIDQAHTPNESLSCQAVEDGYHAFSQIIRGLSG